MTYSLLTLEFLTVYNTFIKCNKRTKKQLFSKMDTFVSRMDTIYTHFTSIMHTLSDNVFNQMRTCVENLPKNSPFHSWCITISLILCNASKSTSHVISVDGKDFAQWSSILLNERFVNSPSTAFSDEIKSCFCQVGLFKARLSLKRY